MIWVDTLMQGILLGGLYALFAAGLSLVFGIMRLVNLAHGDLIVLAAYLILTISSALGLHPFLAVFLPAFLKEVLPGSGTQGRALECPSTEHPADPRG